MHRVWSMNEKPNRPKTFSDLLAAAGHTQTSLAASLGITRQAVGLYANGKAAPDLARATQIGRVLGVGIDELADSIRASRRKVRTRRVR